MLYPHLAHFIIPLSQLCALARISDLCVVRELVLTAQKEVGGYNTGTVQHCKVMILDVGVFAVIRLSSSIQEQAMSSIERAFLRHNLYAE